MTVEGVKGGHMTGLAGTGLGLLAAVTSVCPFSIFVIFLSNFVNLRLCQLN